MATLKSASSAGPPAAPDTSEHTPVMTPTATGCERRNHRATKATRPSAKSTAIAGPLWSDHVAVEDERAEAGGDRVHGEVDDPVARRAPAVHAAPQLARQQHPLPARQLDVLVGCGRHVPSVRTGCGADPRPKSTRPSTPGRGGGWSATPILAAMIDSEALTKRYGGRTVLQDVSFRCEPGTVTGFLGPNGAGKTTTLRVLCGLSEPDTGRATVLGGSYRDLPNPARRVGVLLDASAQHPGRRGREVLAVSAQTIGVPERRVDDLLERVGLDRSAARKRVRQYSLGMRQRLGLAHAHARRPGGPDPRRAGQRPGPRGHALDARAAARLRRPRRHRAALLAPARGGAGGRRPDRDHRRGADRRPGRARRPARRRGHARVRGRPRAARARAADAPASTPAPQPTARSWSTPPPRPSGAPRFRAASPSPTWGPPRGRASRPCTSS